MKMKSNRNIIVLVATFLLVGEAIALNFTANIHREGRAGSKLYCYTDFTIDQAGNWRAYTKYSNGRKVEGNRFYSVITLKASDGRQIMIIPQNYWLGGAGFGGATEKGTTANGQVTPKIVSLIAEEKTGYSCQTVRDDAVSIIKKAAEIAAWVKVL